jgi:hypothetical protein
VVHAQGSSDSFLERVVEIVKEVYVKPDELRYSLVALSSAE